MSDSAVPRVLWALERVAAALRELEEQGRAGLAGDQWLYADTTRADREELLRDREFRLGRIDGLVAAQLATDDAIRAYRHKHGAARGGRQADILAALAEERPATGL